jgi:hypothetical protein
LLSEGGLFSGGLSKLTKYIKLREEKAMKFTISLATVLCITLAGVLLLGVPAVSAQEDTLKLGDLGKDYVYSPVDPCRIVDTRVSTVDPGPMLADTWRRFKVYGVVQGQNGGAPNPPTCPAPKGEPRAVHINVTALGGDQAGHLRVYPVGIATPNASWVNFMPYENIANAGTVKTLSSAALREIEVYASKTAGVVIDVLGYYYDVDTVFWDWDFQTGPGLDPIGDLELSFFVEPATVTVSHKNRQLIHVVSHKSFQTESRDASRLDLYICYFKSGLGISTVGDGVKWIKFENDWRLPLGLSAIFAVPENGTYDVGLCGETKDWNWNNLGNDHSKGGYTSAFVFEEAQPK